MKLWQFDAENVVIQWLKFGRKKTSGYWNIFIKIELPYRINRHFLHQVNALIFFSPVDDLVVRSLPFVGWSLATASGLSGSHLTGLMKMSENFFRQFNSSLNFYDAIRLKVQFNFRWLINLFLMDIVEKMNSSKIIKMCCLSLFFLCILILVHYIHEYWMNIWLCDVKNRGRNTVNVTFYFYSELWRRKRDSIVTRRSNALVRRHRSASDMLTPLSFGTPPVGAPCPKQACVPQHGGRDLTPASHTPHHNLIHTSYIHLYIYIYIYTYYISKF